MKKFGLELLQEPLPGLLLLAPKMFGDERGYFFESFRAETTLSDWLQDNESMSARGVLRGLHFQAPPFHQSKLVSVVQGSAYDVAVDIRPLSPTYGQHFGAILSSQNHHRLHIPAGFAHGFLTLEDHTIFQYKCSALYAPEAEGCIDFNDPTLGIDWAGTWGASAFHPTLSAKDQSGSPFDTFHSPFTGPQFDPK